MQVFRNSWLLFLCVVLLVAANVSLYRTIFAPRVLTVSVLDVGKGSATLVRTSGDMLILVNAGPDASVLRALGGALPLWQRRIDAVVLTGARPVLAGGLPDVERRYHIGAVVRAGDARVPYGAALVFDGTRVIAVSSDTFSISYGAAALTVSSTTPVGVYAWDGGVVVRAK